MAFVYANVFYKSYNNKYIKLNYLVLIFVVHPREPYCIIFEYILGCFINLDTYYNYIYIYIYIYIW